MLAGSKKTKGILTKRWQDPKKPKKQNFRENEPRLSCRLPTRAFGFLGFLLKGQHLRKMDMRKSTREPGLILSKMLVFLVFLVSCQRFVTFPLVLLYPGEGKVPKRWQDPKKPKEQSRHAGKIQHKQQQHNFWENEPRLTCSIPSCPSYVGAFVWSFWILSAFRELFLCFDPASVMAPSLRQKVKQTNARVRWTWGSLNVSRGSFSQKYCFFLRTSFHPSVWYLTLCLRVPALRKTMMII